MKLFLRVLLFVGLVLVVAFTGLVYSAGGWADFKLRYGPHFLKLINDEESIREARRAMNPDKGGARLRVEESDLVLSGPAKNGIPSVDDPAFVTPDESTYGPDGRTRVIGVTHDGEAQAYPLGILSHHRIVNSSIGGVNIAVTYSPLCDTYLVVQRGDTTYGVTGRLYQSCLVMYARDNESLFVQPWGLGVAGVDRNKQLPAMPGHKTTLRKWLRKHPNSHILSTQTGYERDYKTGPYKEYRHSGRLLFPVRNYDNSSRFSKSPVYYYRADDRNATKGHYTGPSLLLDPVIVRRRAPFTVSLDGTDLTVRFDGTLHVPRIYRNGAEQPLSSAFGFVYPALFTKEAHTLTVDDSTVRAVSYPANFTD